jgi:hypothetical protein
MKIAIVGSNGSIGRRYCACLDFLGYDVVKIDLPRPSVMPSFDRAIIATPTNSHYENLREFLTYKIPVLIEKPVSKSLREISLLISLDKMNFSRVVCNWKFVPGMREHSNLITYNNYYTGQDGTMWDMCQIVYLSNGSCKIETTSPVFKCTVNKLNVTLLDIERSYIFMLDTWMTNADKLWTLHEGYEMTSLVLEKHTAPGY